jgi:acyl carrier protein
MSIERELARYIGEELAVSRRGEEVRVDEPLVSMGRMDSLGLISLMSWVHEKYGVDLLSFGEPSDFDTVQGVADAVRRAQEAADEDLAQVS